MPSKKITLVKFFCPKCDERAYVNKDTTKIEDNVLIHNDCLLKYALIIGFNKYSLNVLHPQNESRFEHGPLNAEGVILIVINFFQTYIDNLSINFGGRKKEDGFNTKINEANINSLLLASRLFCITCKRITLSPIEAFQFIWDNNKFNTRLREKIYFICNKLKIKIKFEA